MAHICIFMWTGCIIYALYAVGFKAWTSVYFYVNRWNSMEIKTEADNIDIQEFARDDLTGNDVFGSDAFASN